MKTILILLVLIIALGFFFVQWANKPENVAALQQERKDKALQKTENEKQQAALKAILSEKKAHMQLVLEEDAAKGQFKFLTLKPDDENMLRFEKDRAVYATLITKGQNAHSFFIFTKDDFEDFMAEVELNLSGYEIYCGIAWDAQLGEKNVPTHYQVAYSSPDYLHIRADDKDNFSLGSTFKSINKQKLRVERIAKHLTVSVNDQVLFDQTVTSSNKGKIGLYFAHGGGGEYPESVRADVTSFKIWQ